jgi:hypothetical protein
VILIPLLQLVCLGSLFCGHKPVMQDVIQYHNISLVSYQYHVVDSII